MTNLERTSPADSIPEYFPSAEAYRGNSVVSIIRLQSLPLIHILKNGSSVSQLESAMLLFFEGSSCYDWTLRLNYIKLVADAMSADKSFAQCQGGVSTHLKLFVQSFGTIFSSHLMVNLQKEFKDIQSTRFGKLLKPIY